MSDENSFKSKLDSLLKDDEAINRENDQQYLYDEKPQKEVHFDLNRSAFEDLDDTQNEIDCFRIAQSEREKRMTMQFENRALRERQAASKFQLEIEKEQADKRTRC